LYHQRDPTADRADDCSSGCGPEGRDHEVDAGGRFCDRAQTFRLDGHTRYRLGVSMERIPILKMAPFLLVTIQVDMHDRLALALQEDLTDKITVNGSKGVLIDISSLEIVDSFIGRMLANIAGIARV